MLNEINNHKENPIAVIGDFLDGQKWGRSICSTCSREFHSLKGGSNCMSEKCLGVQIPKDPNVGKVEAIEVGQKLANFFGNLGYEQSYPLGVVNRNNKWGKTSLVVSGVQRLVPYLSNGAYIAPKVFIAQPSVRTQYRGMDEDSDWSASSFVNPSIVHGGANLDVHTCAIKSWLECLTDLGVDMNGVSLKQRQSKDTWDEKEFTRNTLDMYFKGLHIADAIYSDDFPYGNNYRSFSDLGTGLERLTGVLNGGDFYIAQRPKDEVLQHPAYYDAVKALTLIVGTGVTPKDKDAWQFVKRYVLTMNETKTESASVAENIDYFHKYWQPFVGEFQDKKSIENIILTESDSKAK